MVEDGFFLLATCGGVNLVPWETLLQIPLLD